MINGGLYSGMEAEVRKMSRSKIITKLNNIHPGEVLSEEFLKPMGITPYRLAKDIFVPQTRISEIIRGKRSITADTAIRFSRFFGTSAEFWMNLQMLYDLENEERNSEETFSKIRILSDSDRGIDEH